MSAVFRTQSFSLVKDVTESGKDVSQHNFMFDASDLAVMHGKLGIYCEMGWLQGVCAALRSSPKRGLFSDEVDAPSGFRRRRQLFGVNIINKPPLTTWFAFCFEALQDPMLMVLMAAGALSLGLGFYHSLTSGWIEGLAIVLAVVLVSTVSATNNVQQERQFRKLDESKEEPSYKVIRAGVERRIKQSDIVVGDLVELSAGDAVPADGVLSYGDDPFLNEARMTGEPLDILKSARDPFLMAGTEVRKGQLVMLVTAVGINTTYGRIMASLVAPSEPTPLQEKLEHTAKLVGYIGLGVAIVLFLTLTAFWIGDLVHYGKSFKDEGQRLLDFFIIAITILVVAVPEGLPLAVTISLAYSMKKMVKDQNLVRILSACETMGNATTICSDKTGTLTQNRMTVMKGWSGGVFYERLNEAGGRLAPSKEIRNLLIEGVVVNSKAREMKDEDSGLMVWTGNQTEIALMQWMMGLGVHIDEERARFVVLKNYPFDSMKKNSSIVIQHGSGYRQYMKGAAEQIFRRCTSVVDANGRVGKIQPHKEAILAAIDRMTRNGLRTIAFGFVDHAHIDRDPADANKLLDPPESNDFTFIAVVGIKDPLRPESRMSVRMCQRAGVIVRMVTGDHMETARYIARECGILTSPKHIVMEGEQFRLMLQDATHEAERVIPYLRVLARSKPEDKRLLVEWLKEHGEVVAVTGDGTNDAPALKEANVGIAMNLVGTEVAKAAASILILDDNFYSIVKSIMWGRSVFDNIRKFVQFQLTVNLVALSLSLIGAFTRFENPLKAVQLLWVNLIMDTMAALSLGTEVPTFALLNRKPYSSTAPLISHVMWRNIVGQAAFQLGVLCWVMYDSDLWGLEAKSIEHFTLVFNTFVFLQLFNEINSRKVNNEMNVFHNLFTNWIFVGVMILTVIFQGLMVELFGPFAQTQHQSIYLWLSAVGLGAGGLLWGVVLRLIKVDDTVGSITIADDTFEGAELHLPDDTPVDLTKPMASPVIALPSKSAVAVEMAPMPRSPTSVPAESSESEDVPLARLTVEPVSSNGKVRHPSNSVQLEEVDDDASPIVKRQETTSQYMPRASEDAYAD